MPAFSRSKRIPAHLGRASGDGETLTPVPVEVIGAMTSRAACGILKHENFDLVCLDAALGPEACADLIGRAKAARWPPFVTLVGAGDEPEGADGMVDMPYSVSLNLPDQLPVTKKCQTPSGAMPSR